MQRVPAADFRHCGNDVLGHQAAVDDMVPGICLISQATTGLSALALKRQLGMIYPAAC